MQTNPQFIRVLAASAFVLAIAAAIVGLPSTKSRVTIDTHELARIVEAEEDHVDAIELAEWIKAGKSDLTIVDLRSRAGFDSTRIPGALNVSLRQLDSALRKTQTIVLYSEGGVHSAQAWFLLKALGYPKVFFLKGGMKEWESEVVYPMFDAGLSSEERTQRTELSKFFGGEVGERRSNEAKKIPAPRKKSVAPKQKPEQQPERDPFRQVC